MSNRFLATAPHFYGLYLYELLNLKRIVIQLVHEKCGSNHCVKDLGNRLPILAIIEGYNENFRKKYYFVAKNISYKMKVSLRRKNLHFKL
jgi:hypothetical protein